MARKSFYDVLTQAINDINEHGYDTQKRIAEWMKALQESAEATLSPRRTMEKILRDSMIGIYKRLVDQRGVLRFHPGIDKFTLKKIKPSLRAELDRRIASSAELIKLNREEMIQQTLRRFAGWSTSIPKGGTEETKRKEVKEKIRKPLARLPFNERRVLIDQGHKLTSAISDIVAKDGGALAGRWHSNWKQSNYNYREDHKLRDKKVYLVRDNWAQKAGIVKPGKVGYNDEITQPGEEVFCRCHFQWIYNLRDLPEDMLTAKGKETLRQVRAEIAKATAR
jgi:hypothetical protein